jgi:hypothetical protein
MSRHPNPQRAVDVWNAKHPIGTKVRVRKDNGDVLSTTTRTKAEVLSGHTAVIWVSDIRGCYLLDRVTPDSALRLHEGG